MYRKMTPEELAAKSVVTQAQVVTHQPVTVTQLVTPKRDRAAYMRNYRAKQKAIKDNRLE